MAGTAPYDITPDQIRAIRGDRGAIGSEELQNIVDDAIDDAESFTDEILAPEREEATRYYYGHPMGTEVPGRSSIVMTEVRDIVHTLIPGLMRIFTGSEHAVEFTPVEQADVAAAEQATDYVDHIFSKDNDGFRVIYDMAIDGLVKKSGICKWWYEEKQEIEEERYDGLTIGQLAYLAQDPDVEILSVEEMQPGQQGGAY